MTRNVTYADLIHAFADGKIVEFRDSYVTGAGWYALEADNTEVLPYFLRTDGHTEGRFQFRLKPRTVKIGNLEVEAPVLEPEVGQTLWYWDNYRDGPCDGEPSKEEASNGEWFASSDAARAAYAAYTALLRGEA